MSRLVIPASKLGTRTQGKAAGDDYLDRVAKYVPAEVLGVYLAAQSLIVAGSDPGSPRRKWSFAIVALVLTVLTPLYLRQRAERGQPWRKHGIVGTISFLVWAYAMAEAARTFGFYDGLIAGIVVLLFSAVSGLVLPVEGEK